MKIGIDARFIGPQGTGLGKYTEKLILNLAKIDAKNHYVIFLRQENWSYLELTSRKNFTKVLADVPWYSLAEQIRLPKIFENANPDLLHIPHFNVPIFYRGKFIVTIHDIIHHKFSEYAATTKNPIVFKLKRFAYRTVISHAIKKSQKILTPSNFVKDEIIKTFDINPDQIIVTYEAAEEEYFNRQPSTVNCQPFLLYVGNAYPHKNLNRLLDAFKILHTQYSILNTRLVLVCPRDVFWQRLQGEIRQRKLEDRVELKGYQTAKNLTKLFQKATTYVFPSLSEGFGIPGLNAMATGLPVICSDIPVLKEVYGDAAVYFDPRDPSDIADKINKAVSNSTLMSSLIDSGYRQAKKYSWLKMAKETLKVYEEAV